MACLKNKNTCLWSVIPFFRLDVIHELYGMDFDIKFIEFWVSRFKLVVNIRLGMEK